MTTTPLITDKENYMTNAIDFFNTLFEPALQSECGEIEIRVFPKGGFPRSFFFGSESEAAESAYELCNSGENVYLGVNPRVGRAGKKENIKYLSAFHAEVDYGRDGHVKTSKHPGYKECLTAIQEFQIEPTVVIHSGGGFHCYWVLSNPVKIEDCGIKVLEGVNKALIIKLGGDPGTQDISRVLRVPGTYNLKMLDNPRLVQVVSNSRKRYSVGQFTGLADLANSIPTERPKKLPEISPEPASHLGAVISVESLPVSEKIKKLILNGNDGTYLSRSHADMAVVSALVNKGVSEDKIREIYRSNPIGEKYRTHNAPQTYLDYTIKKARETSNLTEEEMQDPLFICGAIHKKENGYQLKTIKFQEYMVRKHRIKILDQERAFFKYNGKCYEQCTDESLNNLCQNELRNFREHFTKSTLNEFIHYAIGDALVISSKANSDQVNYLTLQNGHYNIDQRMLIPHSPDIFTTNLLPYDYDPLAGCPRFMQFLEEIFLNDKEIINFVQEAVGYAFHKSMPTPAVFFLIGKGSNGKSVFINTITKLVGEENAANVSFNLLSDKHFILELFQKMINISGETPQVKIVNTDLVKAVTAGDWVTGRQLYKEPMKFRPYAKHYLSMNTLPVISDTSHGMWRRVWLIDFPRTISEDEMDRGLEKRLAAELSGIFNWALEGYQRLRSRDFRLMESQSMKLSKQDYRIEMDSVRAFASSHLLMTNDQNERLLFGEVYNQYLLFCQNEDKIDLETKSDFKRGLIQFGYKISNSTKEGNQICLFGVRLVNNLEEKPIKKPISEIAPSKNNLKVST